MYTRRRSKGWRWKDDKRYNLAVRCGTVTTVESMVVRSIISSSPFCRSSRAASEQSPWDGGTEEREAPVLHHAHQQTMFSGYQVKLTMNFIVLPSQTLRDPDASPLRLAQDPQGAIVVRAEVRVWDELEEWLGQDDMTIFEFVVGIFIRVVYPVRLI